MSQDAFRPQRESMSPARISLKETQPTIMTTYQKEWNNLLRLPPGKNKSILQANFLWKQKQPMASSINRIRSSLTLLLPSQRRGQFMYRALTNSKDRLDIEK